MVDHNPVSKLFARDKPGLRPAINAMCAHCMGCTRDHMEPGFKQRVRDCSSPDCPIWAVRPSFGGQEIERNRDAYKAGQS